MKAKPADRIPWQNQKFCLTVRERQENAENAGSNILIAYFSRWGNTEYPDDVDASTSASIVLDGEKYGATEYVANLIRQNVGGDIHSIETVTPYTDDFDELRDVNHDEMEQGILPKLKESGLDVSSYDTVFVGYPVWATEVGGTVLEGVLYDTPLAREIKEYFPLTVSMTGYGGREYYGGVDFYPENLEGGQRNFENGDITYCEAHHNMAVFYAQTDHPDLSVDVIPIGKVTSDLSVFDSLDGTQDITFSIKQ